MSGAETTHPSDAIAVIGLACRFPKAPDAETYWQNLASGREVVSSLSPEELRGAGVPDELIQDPSYVRARAILEDVESFDALFFGYPPREAELMDPQHRFFLECAWEALESAGYDAGRYHGRIGVYAGVSMNTYFPNLLSNPDVLKSADPFQLMLGNDKDFIATRVSYKLNLKGPSVVVQSACSTSLVAAHLAFQSLLSGECDMAMAGGACLTAARTAGYTYMKGGIGSPDGHCRPFDAASAGTVPGHGVGIVVLKRLEDAIRDGDCIRALIRGSAINNDGSVKVGYTAPSVEGQAQCIAEAQALAGVDPETIQYIEAHGTGTELGDPIEIAGLTQAFRRGTDKNAFCAIGAVKSNMGHLDIASGVAGLIKTILVLEHRQIPPTLHFQTPNPRIDFARTPFFVNTELRDWIANGSPRRAGVSSFGIGGTNCHVVLEEAPPASTAGASRAAQLLLVSAKSESALGAAVTNLGAHLRRHEEQSLADVAFTLQVGRKPFAQRAFLVSRDRAEAADILKQGLGTRVRRALQESKDRQVAFLFSGQGAQYVQMARGLYDGEATFRAEVDRCSDFLTQALRFDLRSILYPDDAHEAAAAERLQQTAVTQPALFVVEYAMARLWMEWGIRPQAMLGHSIGEYVAACLAGVLSLEDALRLVAARGRLMQDQPAGAMLAVPLDEADAKELLSGGLSLAAVNGPSRCVVAGPAPEIDALEKSLAARGLPGRRLLTSHAFHSSMMDGVLGRMADEAKSATLRPPQIPYISNVTGDWVTAQDATDPAYWSRHLRQAVRFGDGVSALLSKGDWILLEVGPGNTLATLARAQTARSGSPEILTSLRHPREASEDVPFALETLGRLWLAGAFIDWNGFYAHERRRRVPLPTYPFERQKYWIEPGRAPRAATPASPTVKKPDLADWFYVPSWERSWRPAAATETSAAGAWLLLGNGQDLGDGLAARLESAGHAVVRVAPGHAFERSASRCYRLDPREREQYDDLWAELEQQGLMPQRIVHLLGAAERETNSGDGEATGLFYGMLALAQSLGRRSPAPRVEILVITAGLHAVTGDETLSPDRALLVGPCRVIPQEYPTLRCRNIDIADSSSDGAQRERCVEQLWAEIRQHSDQTMVAYRGAHRWIQRFSPVRLSAAPTRPSALRERGVYLITGGLGGIGLELAEYLAQTVRARLVLVGRSAFPRPEEWAGRLESEPESDVSRKIRRLQRLQALGAEILVRRADVAKHGELEAVVSEARVRFGAIHGVVHAAGVAGGGLIQLATAAATRAVLEPKVAGTLNLYGLLGDSADFFVLCSSVAALVGGFRQVDYCAANAFQDAFAHAMPRVLAVNWAAWQEVGMVKNAQVENGILSREGVEAFARVLSQPLAQVVVSPIDLQSWIEGVDALFDPHEGAVGNGLEALASGEAQEVPAASRHARPNMKTAYAPPQDGAQQTLVEVWQELLGIDPIGINDNFFELGGDSIIGLRVAVRANERGLGVTAAHLFEYQTVAELAEQVACGEPAAEKAADAAAVPISADEFGKAMSQVSFEEAES